MEERFGAQIKGLFKSSNRHAYFYGHVEEAARYGHVEKAVRYASFKFKDINLVL